MGTVLARDLLMWTLRKIKDTDVRQLCGKCAFKQSASGYKDIPFTLAELNILDELRGANDERSSDGQAW